MIRSRIGIVGFGERNAPRIFNITRNNQDGGTIEVPVRTFKLVETDRSRGKQTNKETGREYWPKKFIDIYMPNTAWGDKIFKKMKPGMLVLIQGRDGEKPKDGYANLSMNPINIEILSPAAEDRARALFNILKEDNVIDEGEVEKYVLAIQDHYKKMSSGEPTTPENEIPSEDPTVEDSVFNQELGKGEESTP